MKEFHAANEPDLSNTAFYLREPNWGEFNSNIVKSVFLYGCQWDIDYDGDAKPRHQ